MDRSAFAPQMSLKKIEYFGSVDQSSSAEMGSSADLDAERQPDSWLGPTPLTVVAAAFLERGARLSHGNRREPDGVSPPAGLPPAPAARVPPAIPAMIPARGGARGLKISDPINFVVTLLTFFVLPLFAVCVCVERACGARACA